jgi:hypothetical protein
MAKLDNSVGAGPVFSLLKRRMTTAAVTARLQTISEIPILRGNQWDPTLESNIVLTSITAVNASYSPPNRRK